MKKGYSYKRVALFLCLKKWDSALIACEEVRGAG